MQLIDFQHFFERRPLAFIIRGGTMRLGQVHPQGRLRRIGLRRSGQILDGLVELARFERVEPQLIETERIRAGQGLSAQYRSRLAWTSCRREKFSCFIDRPSSAATSFRSNSRLRWNGSFTWLWMKVIATSRSPLVTRSTSWKVSEGYIIASPGFSLNRRSPF